MAVRPSSTAEPEIHRLCPVCPGLPMQKLVLGAAAGRTTLDACRRCGGVWFDAGEVDRLRRLGLKALEARLSVSPEAFRKRCGRCEAFYGRNEDRCPACRAPNELRCPGCARMLVPFRTGAAKLDGCRGCRGVWFDSVELTAVWNQALDRRPRTSGLAAANVASVSVDTLWYGSLLFADGSAAGATTAAELAGGAAAVGAEAGAGVVEATTEMASSVFEAIAELIAGLLG